MPEAMMDKEDKAARGTETTSQARARVMSVHAAADHGRHHFTGEKLANIEDDDPFVPVFEAIDKAQELALPLLFGACRFLAVIPGGNSWLFPAIGRWATHGRSTLLTSLRCRCSIDPRRGHCNDHGQLLPEDLRLLL